MHESHKMRMEMLEQMAVQSKMRELKQKEIYKYTHSDPPPRQVIVHHEEDLQSQPQQHQMQQQQPPYAYSAAHMNWVETDISACLSYINIST